MGKVPPTHVVKVAEQDPALVYQVQDQGGKVRTLFLTHPGGNRVQRRLRQRHHPFFTKTHTDGRDWLIAMKERHRAQAEARNEKEEN